MKQTRCQKRKEKSAAAGFLAALMKGSVGKNAGYLNSIWEYSNPASGWM